MSRIKIKDNSRMPKESLSGISLLTSKIADKTLEQLENERIFVFPEILRDADDITKDQMILRSVNNYYLSSNVMGFMGLGDEKLIVESRFSGNGQDFLFQYLLERVFDVPNIVDLEIDANHDDRIFNLLVFIFPHYLKSAMRKGVFKTYVRKTYNDSNVNYKKYGLLDKKTANPLVKMFVYLMSNDSFRRDFEDKLLSLSENELEKEHALAECKKIREIYEPLYPQFFTRYFGTEQAEYKTEDAIGGGYASYQCLVDFLGGRADTIPGIVNWIEKTEKRLE